ncbi:MAG: hypothetical protein AAGI01_11615 [Myxococcota bacterium]
METAYARWSLGHEAFGELRSSLEGRRYAEAAGVLAQMVGPSRHHALAYLSEILGRGPERERPSWRSDAGRHWNPLEVMLGPPHPLDWEWHGYTIARVRPLEMMPLLYHFACDVAERVLTDRRMDEERWAPVLELRRQTIEGLTGAVIHEELVGHRHRLKAWAGEQADSASRFAILSAMWVTYAQPAYAAQGAARNAARSEAGDEHEQVWALWGAELDEVLASLICSGTFG